MSVRERKLGNSSLDVIRVKAAIPVASRWLLSDEPAIHYLERRCF